MTKGLGITIGIAGAVILLIGSLFFGYLGFSNQANSFENGIKAQYDENQNVYDNGWKKVTEIAQVPAAQVAALKDVYIKAISGTYGANGSTAMFQAMKERNIDINQNTYLKVQQVIEEFRNTFQQRQTEMVSRSQSYANYLTATTSGRFYNMFTSYPHIDMNKYAKLVTSDQTETTFKNKKADALNVFGTPKP